MIQNPIIAFVFGLLAILIDPTAAAQHKSQNLRGRRSLFSFTFHERCQLCRTGSELSNPRTVVEYDVNATTGESKMMSCRTANMGGMVGFISSTACTAATLVCECVSSIEIDTPQQQQSWPELLGSSGNGAKQTIEAQRPDLFVQVLSDDAFYSADYRLDRVRIFIDVEGNVSSIPKIG